MRVLITGANRGIGAALAAHYGASGSEVIGAARDGSQQIHLDVTDTADQLAMARHMAGRPLDLLICNAGVYFDKRQTLNDGYPPEQWADSFAVNVAGVFQTIQSLLPALRAADAAKIAIISSQMGSQEKAPGGSYIYRASKAAVLNLGRNLAVDLKIEGIAVGIYHPGWVRTDMGGQGGSIAADTAAAGLAGRFAALSLKTTGCFEAWDGHCIPF